MHEGFGHEGAESAHHERAAGAGGPALHKALSRAEMFRMPHGGCVPEPVFLIERFGGGDGGEEDAEGEVFGLHADVFEEDGSDAWAAAEELEVEEAPAAADEGESADVMAAVACDVGSS